MLSLESKKLEQLANVYGRHEARTAVAENRDESCGENNLASCLVYVNRDESCGENNLA
jgi:hypothetical protein